MKIKIKTLVDTLPHRELIVIILRHCSEVDLESPDKTVKLHTLEEVGKIFGVSRERIRQIEAKALRKLND